ncbi:radiation-sensitive protein 28 [Monosporozyma unispora]|nr:hypothetical protein C6P44_002861 [Kazachstania unispora]
MNELYQQYKLGLIPYRQWINTIKINQFENLIENSKQVAYKTSKLHQSYQNKINCLDLDQFDKGKFLLSGHDDGSITLWSLDSGKTKSNNELINTKLNISKRLTTQQYEDNDNINTPPPSTLIYSTQTRTNKFRMYRGGNGKNKRIKLSQSHEYGITTLKWYGPDNGMFFTGGNDSMIKIWDTNEFTTVQELNFNYKINQIDCVAKTPFIVIACEDYYPRLIDLKTLNMGVTVFGKKTGKDTTNKCEILACKINPRDNNIIASSDIDGHIKLWDIRMGNQLLHELIKSDIRQKAHTQSCNDLIWNEEGNKLISIGLDGKIIEWDPFDNNLYENKFNDKENMNYYLIDKDELNIVPNYRMIGDIDTMRNRYKKRISKRMEWFNDKYLIVVTDYGQLQIFDTMEGKYWNKLELPLEYNSGKTNRGQFTGIALQQDMTNSRGIRLLTGTNTMKLVDNVQVMNDCPLLEYTL